MKEARDAAAEREQHFEKELATAQKLSALLNRKADDRAARCTQLEGIVRELKDHLQVGCTAPSTCTMLDEKCRCVLLIEIIHAMQGDLHMLAAFNCTACSGQALLLAKLTACSGTVVSMASTQI